MLTNYILNFPNKEICMPSIKTEKLLLLDIFQKVENTYIFSNKIVYNCILDYSKYGIEIHFINVYHLQNRKMVVYKIIPKRFLRLKYYYCIFLIILFRNQLC